jgi:hypothetical protein
VRGNVGETWDTSHILGIPPLADLSRDILLDTADHPIGQRVHD